MPIEIKKNSAAAAAEQEAVTVMDYATLILQDNQRWRNEAAAAASDVSTTSSSTSETSTSISTAFAALCNATLARNMRRGATAKRKRQVSEEDDDDIVPKKDARILAMANQNLNFLSKQRDEMSSSSDEGEGEGEYDMQKGQPTQYGSNGASMPNHVIADHGHTYRDFSTHIEEGGMIETHIESERNFPACLHEMVSNEHYSHIISWMPHGRAWKVHSRNKRLLVGEPILGKILGLPSYSSFTRELSEWGFKMLHQAGPDYGCYYHECFLRGHPQLTVLMKKTAEPDFHAIAKQRPLEKSADVERGVLFLADVALQYSFDSSDSGQNEVPAKTASKYPSRVSRKKRSARKKSLKVSPKEKAPDLEDLPPQSEDNPAVIITRLNALMKRTHMTQKQLEKHDKQNGLPRSHAQTMLRSSRSRSQLQKALKKNKRELRKMLKKQDDE